MADALDLEDRTIRCWHWGDVPHEYWMDTNSGGDEEFALYIPPALVPPSWRTLWQEQRERDAADPFGCAAYGDAFVASFRVAEWIAWRGDAWDGDDWHWLWLGHFFNHQHVFEHPSGGAFVRIEH